MSHIDTTKQVKYFKGSMYDHLKFVALVFMPGLSSLYFGLGQIWGFPAIEEVIGSIAVVDTVLGGLLGISTVNYNKSGAKYDGTLTKMTDENGIVSIDSRLHGIEDPRDIDQKKELLFKVKTAGPGEQG